MQVGAESVVFSRYQGHFAFLHGLVEPFSVSVRYYPVVHSMYHKYRAVVPACRFIYRQFEGGLDVVSSQFVS